MFAKLEAKIANIGKKLFKNAAIKTADGSTTLYNEGTMLVVGDAVFTDEAMTTPAPDGEYTLETDLIAVVAGGVVTALNPVQSNETDPLKAEIETLKAQLAEKETALNEAQAKAQEADTKVAEVEAEFTNFKKEFNTIKADLKAAGQNFKEQGGSAPKNDALDRKAQELKSKY